MRHLTLVLLVIVSIPAVVNAQLLYPLQQERFVHVRVPLTGDDPNQPRERFASATDFSLWQASVCMESVAGPAGNADQYSVMTDSTIDAFGTTDIRMQPSYYNEDPPGSSHSAQSYCRLRFAVLDPATVDLVGYISVELDGAQSDPYYQGWNMNVSLSVQLNRIAGNVVYETMLTIHMDQWDWLAGSILGAPVELAGQLEPGVYELTVDARFNGGIWRDSGGPLYLGQTSYIVSAEFATPPPVTPGEGDLDGDGDVDIADFARMQAAFTGPMLQ